MTTAEAQPLTVSATQMERLRSTLAAMTAAETAAAEAAEAQGLAKSDRDSKQDSFRQAVDGIEGEEATDDEEHRIAGLSVDLRRSEQRFTEADREKRSRADHEKKLKDRFLKVAMEIAEGQPDLYSKDIATSDAWKGVLLADIVGDLHAAQFVKAGLHTIGDVCEGYKRITDLVKSGDITQQGMDFVCQQVAEAMVTRMYGKHLPAEMRKLAGKERKAMPKAEKPAKAEAEGDEE
jgi:hypothetical protein